MLLKWLSWKVKENIDVCFQSISLKTRCNSLFILTPVKLKFDKTRLT